MAIVTPRAVPIPREAESVVVCVDMLKPDQAIEFTEAAWPADVREARAANAEIMTQIENADEGVQWYTAYAIDPHAFRNTRYNALMGRLLLVGTWDVPEYNFDYYDTGVDEPVERQNFKLLIGYLDPKGDPIPEEQRIQVGPGGY